MLQTLDPRAEKDPQHRADDEVLEEPVDAPGPSLESLAAGVGAATRVPEVVAMMGGRLVGHAP